MVDLKGQYLKIKEEIDGAIAGVLDSCSFINGKQVDDFAQHLAEFTGAKYVVPCANGTDALQIALMALMHKSASGRPVLQPGDEVIVPAFTYVATAEVIGLLGLVPVMVDVDYNTFNIDLEDLEALDRAVSEKTKAIVPVHLFGQCANMEPLMAFAKKHNLYVIEDVAQAIGAKYTFSDGRVMQAATIGDIGCTSFFPSKNLGCYGDGGALFTNDEHLAALLKMIANHGQKVKYKHSVIGCNSRLDTIQAAILDVKLKYLNDYSASRQMAAAYYTQAFEQWDKQQNFIVTPAQVANSTHVYHQYTLKVLNDKRDALKEFLNEAGIPAMIYYPLPLQEQDAFKPISRVGTCLNVSRDLAYSVLSLPMHTEITREQQDMVIAAVKRFF